MKKTCLMILAGALSTIPPLHAQNQTLAEIRNMRMFETRSAGFVLDRDQSVQIELVGALGNGRGHKLLGTSAWILNAKTREVVWQARSGEERRRSRKLLELQDTAALDKGEYEVYFSSFYYGFYSSDDVKGFGDAIGNVFDRIFDWNRRDERFDDQIYDEAMIVVKGAGRAVPDATVDEWRRELTRDAIVTLTHLSDEAYERQGFTLERPMDVQIYALGEIRYEESYDYGWIMNAKTHEKIWQFSYRNSEHGGGDKKNRLFNEVISLPAGDYVAYFVTDDSHSSREWNATPPYDPNFWGMVIRPAETSMKAYVKNFEYADPPETNVIVKFTRVGDNDYHSKGFTLKKALPVRIYAIGEGRDGEMFDYGWIADAKTGKKVWEMNYRDTDHAGGASKNRMIDEVIRFEPGSYMAYYVSDGSHSYRDWNSSAPFDREHWGLTLYAADEKFNPKDIADFEEERDRNVIAQLIRVRDSERRRTSFKLEKSGQVRVYAIGEGRDGSMFDYGWIEDAISGRTVWEMTYRMTDHAGGGDKNRVFNDTILLKPGEYELFFSTDDSHSFNDWNTSPPHDPGHYGITLYRVE